jgi:hypothetical protein
MKQTAVEWLMEWMSKSEYFIGKGLLEVVEQAKEMEKEQMHAEYMRGWKDGLTKQQEL